jgi:ferredoxin-type protein NapH
VAAPATTPRERLGPSDLRFTRARWYQRPRRLSLLASFAVIAFVPAWHLLALRHAQEGYAPLVGAPWAVRVLGLELVDPLAGAGLIATGGFGWPLFWGLVPTALLVAVLGRFFCGWMCPYVPVLAASNAARSLLKAAGVKVLDLRLPRRTGLVLLVGLLVATFALGAQLLPLLYPPSIFGREAFRLVFFGGVGGGLLVLMAAFAFDTFVSRAGFCRSLCPGGALFSALAIASPFTVKRTVSACTDCTACDVVCNLGQRPMTDQLDAGCERCGKCVSVCPTGALSWGLARRLGGKR